MSTHFIHLQLQASERLFEMMKQDHNKRMQEIVHWGNTCNSLMMKLAERDEELDHLRRQVEFLKSQLREKRSEEPI